MPTGADGVADWLEGHADKVTAGLIGTVGKAGQMMLTRAKANASGRPGPRAQTGDYRRSIGLNVGLIPGGARAVVGTNKVQGRRLEYGFVGTDSLGRIYSQPPLAHMQPALDETAPELKKALADLIQRSK